MSLSPFVFIGVGGSGGKTLRVIHDVLAGALTQVGWKGDWPQAWQFLHIEVASKPDGIEPGLPFTLPLSDFAPLTTPASTYRSIDGAVSRTGAKDLDHYLAWDSWRPYPPDHVPVTISLGAGQYRAIGRVALLSSLSEVGGRVSDVLADALSADASELESIQKALGGESLGTGNIVREPTVMVIASLSGGSGSGALLDVCDVVRTHRPGETTNVFSVVYAPEVFEGDGGRLEPGIAPNTFVALNELLNASWVRGAENLPLSREVHFSRSGVNPHRDRTGPDTVFMVGRRNGNVELGNTSEIYRVIGRSLADLALNEPQQDSLNAYSVANAASIAAGVDHNVPVAADRRDTPTPRATNLHALGFARLSVGREIFREYAAQRLAKAAVIRLREGHLLQRQPGDRRTDEALTEEFAAARWGSFIRDSRLNEVSYNENAVIDAILPPSELNEILANWVSATQQAIDETSRNGQLPVGEARQQIADEIENAIKPGGLLPGFKATLTQRAIEWRRGVEGTDADDEVSIHRTLAELIIGSAATSGLRVTELLLEKLKTEVETAHAELVEEAKMRRKDASDSLRTIIDPSPTEPRKVDTEAGGYVEQTLIGEQGYSILSELLYSEAVELAAGVLAELPIKLITPALRALRDAADNLREEAQPANNRTSDFQLWPGDTGVPEHLVPSRVERTLDVISEFPADFLKLMESSTGAGSQLEGVGVAVEEIIQGMRLATQYNAPAPYFYQGRWAPESDALRAARESPTTAVLEVRISLADLLARARAWVSDTEKAIGRHVAQTMSEYLTDKEVGAGVRNERRARVVGEFREMLRLAQPLVKIDADNLQLAHGIRQPDYDLVMSAIDIPKDDRDLRQELSDVAQGILNQPTKIAIGAAPLGTQVMTTLKQPIHPIAMQSVMEPIYTQWDADHTGQNFWSYRRARPLLEWVPLAPFSQLALAEGWVTARLLGHAYVSQNAEDLGWRIHIKNNQGDRHGWVTLPSTGPRSISKDDALGNVFELVALSSLEVYRKKSLAPLDPYRTLVEFGAAPWDEHRLASWVASGNHLETNGEALLEPADDADTRTKLLLGGLKDMETRFLGYGKTSGKTVEELQRWARVEVSRIGVRAIESIRTKLRNASEDPYGGKA